MFIYLWTKIGYLVPINCENSGAHCSPSTVAEKTYIKNLIEGFVNYPIHLQTVLYLHIRWYYYRFK